MFKKMSSSRWIRVTLNDAYVFNEILFDKKTRYGLVTILISRDFGFYVGCGGTLDLLYNVVCTHNNNMKPSTCGLGSGCRNLP